MRSSYNSVNRRAAFPPISALEAIIDKTPSWSRDFRSGKEKAFNALIAQAMKATKGQADPTQVTELLQQKLAGSAK